MQDINAWLFSERDFTKGVGLYLKYGSNSFFKRMLDAGPTPYNVKKLGEELEALAPGEPAAEESKNLKVKIQKPVTSAALKPVIKELQSTASELAAAHRMYMHYCTERDKILPLIDRNMAFLAIDQNKISLFQTAKQILSLHQKKTELWAKIDYYREHGCFETIPQKPEKTREQKMQLIYQAISRANTRLKNPNYKGAARKKTEKLIADKRAELEVLKGGAE